MAGTTECISSLLSLTHLDHRSQAKSAASCMYSGRNASLHRLHQERLPNIDNQDPLRPSNQPTHAHDNRPQPVLAPPFQPQEPIGNRLLRTGSLVVDALARASRGTVSDINPPTVDTLHEIVSAAANSKAVRRIAEDVDAPAWRSVAVAGCFRGSSGFDFVGSWDCGGEGEEREEGEETCGVHDAELDS